MNELQMLAESIKYHADNVRRWVGGLNMAEAEYIAKMLISDGWVVVTDGSATVNGALDEHQPSPWHPPAQLSEKWRHLAAVKDEGPA